MSTRIAEYRINTTTFRVIYGSITEIDADAIVSSDDSYLSMGGGVSMAIRHAAGEELASEAKKLIPVPLGKAAFTSGFNLPAKYIFHAITIDYDTWTFADEKMISSATAACLNLAETLGVKHIAFPALGTGAAGVPFQVTCKAMMDTIGKHLLGDSKIEKLTITLHARAGISVSDLNIFYEQAVGQAAIYSQNNKLNLLLIEMEAVLKESGRKDLLPDIHQLKNKIHVTQKVIDEPEEIDSETEVLGELVHEIDQFTDKTVKDFNNKQLEIQLLQTKISGLYTTLNIKVAQLMKNEREKAKYGGIGIPPILEFAIEEGRQETEEMETKIRDLKKRLIELGNPF